MQQLCPYGLLWFVEKDTKQTKSSTLDSIAVPVFAVWLNLTNTESEWIRDEVPYLVDTTLTWDVSIIVLLMFLKNCEQDYFH